jgi:hypothetical protein
MGYMRHHAIVVTSWQEEAVRDARAAAVTIGCAVSEMLRAPVNGYWSFFIAPDGSKEGWPASDEGDRRRDEFVEWIESHTGDEQSRWLSWVEVQYGDDDGEAALIRGSDENLTETDER